MISLQILETLTYASDYAKYQLLDRGKIMYVGWVEKSRQNR